MVNEYYKEDEYAKTVVTQDTAKEMTWLRTVWQCQRTMDLCGGASPGILGQSPKHGNTPELIKK